MEYKLNYIQKLLSTQDYLEFDKILTVMSEEIKKVGRYLNEKCFNNRSH